MKNLTIYVGTIKKCLNLEGYKKDGDYTFIPDCEISTSCSRMISGYNRPNTKIINEQAILIEKNHHFYEFKLTNSFVDNLKIIFDLGNFMWTEPELTTELFCPEEKLVPYYEEQPKKLTFRKLKQDLLLDPRIKTGIEH